MVVHTCSWGSGRRRTGQRFIALGCLVLCAWLAVPVRAVAQSPAEAKAAPALLEVGKPSVRTVTERVALAFEISLSAGEYVAVAIEHAELCSSPILLDPDGKTLLVASEAAGALNGRARIEFVADRDGVYELVTTAEPRAEGGRGTVTVAADVLRPAMDADRARAAAYRLLADGATAALDASRTIDARRDGIAALVEASARWRGLGDAARELDALGALAAGYAASGLQTDAVRALSDSVALARTSGDSTLLLPLLVNLASLELDLGDGKALDAALDEAFDLIRAMGGDDLVEWNAYRVRGDSRRRQGNYRDAHEYFDRGNEIGERIGLGPGSLNMEIAWLEIDEGRLVEALGDFRTLAAAAERRDDFVSLRRSLMATSQILTLLGDYQGAIEACERGIVVARKTQGEFGLCFLKSQLGYVYLDLGELDEAASSLEEGLRIARADGYTQLVGNAQVGLGHVYLARGDARAALAAYEDAVSALDATGFSEGVAVALTGSGNAYAALGDAARSDASFERALDMMEARGKLIDREIVRLTYADALVVHDPAKAARILDRAIEIGRELHDRKGIATALYQFARIDRDAGRLESAKARIREAIDVVESLRSGIKSPERRTSYFAKVRAYYDLYTDILMRSGGAASVAEAFAVAERGRGRVLLETLSERGVDLTAGVDSVLRADERETRRQLVGSLDYQVRLLGREHTPEEAGAVAREIAGLESRLDEIEGRIRAASPAYAALTSPEPVTVDGLQHGLLDSDTALVAYTLGEDAGYVWAVTTEGVTSARVPGRKAIEARVRRLRQAVAARACAPKNEAADERGARLKAADAAYRTEARGLGDEILNPVARAIAGKRLAVVPDGALALVPFGALVEPGTDRYVIEGHEVVTLPSATALRTLRKQEADRPTPEGAVAVVADPVFDASDERVTTAKKIDAPKLDDARAALRAAGSVGEDGCGERAGLERLRGSAREAKAIAALAPESERLEATGFTANLDLATSGELGRYRIVHFATHGYVPAAAPELSGLVLSLVDESGRERPGYLGMPQIYAMRLPVETVVLSACETGLGREVRGEGIVGLVRGFMYAGANRVVSSLWKIDDEETARLMEALYAGMLKRGLRPAAALREAQLKMIGEKRPPYVWGAFQLAGEWR